jgi:hypothetical protein
LPSGSAIDIRLLGTKAKLLIKSLNKQQMKNWKTSAQTAAKQSSKSSLLFHPAALAAILLLAAVFSSCETPQGQSVEETSDNYNIKVIDSCEYIEFDSGIFDQRVYSLTHKGNCKFCAARHSR